MDAGDDVVELKEVVVDGGNVFDTNSTSYADAAGHDTGASTGAGDGAGAASSSAQNEKTNGSAAGGTLSKQSSNMPLMSGFAHAVHNFTVGETKRTLARGWG